MDPAGEHLLFHAAATPDKVSVVMNASGATRTYGEIAERSGRLARVLYDRGMRKGDHVAVLLDNQPEFYDVVWAAMRVGAYVTPINWHLVAAEAGYIVDNCNATAFFGTSRLTNVITAMGDHLVKVKTRISVDGGIPGFERLDDVIAGVAPGLDDEDEGGWMFYSSGTTGQPKGILPPLPTGELGAKSFLTMMLTGMFGFTTDTVYLSPGAPLYHAAPAGWTYGTQRVGGTSIVMEKFEPLEVLAAIERHRVTHVQFVPTHMIRLLKLTDEERSRYDLSSLQVVVHAAAPCPVETKQRFIEWVGPIVHEFYSGTEGAGLTYVNSEDWLKHPGTVGKSMTGEIHIVGDDGEELPIGEEGEVWFSTTRRFEYYQEPEKTKQSWDERGWSWMGDVGRVDDDGYLYLTDRASNMIISGGVNIYPREIEDILTAHPAVYDVAVLGTPDPDMGEHVTAFVQLSAGATATDDELIAFCRERLSHFKCPKEVRFVDELPRLPTGKLLKRLLLR
ncbi:MAG: long-chain acyl-CoA synthetase [Actinomycetota bacterium]|jgi:acyl-CoA synthetase (AMP-forming)/AMP-acid ligase II